MTSWWQQKEKRMTTRVTLETLAAMVKEGFEAVNRRFEEMDRRFDRIELRLDQCAYRFEVAELSARVERLERKAGLTATT